MPKKMFSAEQIVARLRQIEVLMSRGTPAASSYPKTPSTPFGTWRFRRVCWRMFGGGLMTFRTTRLMPGYFHRKL